MSFGARRTAATWPTSRTSRTAKDIDQVVLDRKSTRLNSSHGYISYAVFCLKKKNIERDVFSGQAAQQVGDVFDQAIYVDHHRLPDLTRAHRAHLAEQVLV